MAEKEKFIMIGDIKVTKSFIESLTLEEIEELRTKTQAILELLDEKK
ncbi:MAG: hypothetical protein FWC68_04815 [Oscillospiraceae bacterium]|nr:hypothetical protein [Oscillospiraceae bacterium]